jgi:hypothetical protein
MLMVAEVFDYMATQIDEVFAETYIENLLEFGNGLAEHAERFSFCRHPQLQAKRYRCAIFQKSYILIYKI